MVEESLSYLLSSIGVCPASTTVSPTGQIWTYDYNNNSTAQHYRKTIPFSSDSLLGHAEVMMEISTIFKLFQFFFFLFMHQGIMWPAISKLVFFFFFKTFDTLVDLFITRETNLIAKTPNRKWEHISATVWAFQTKLCLRVKDHVLKDSKKFCLNPSYGVNPLLTKIASGLFFRTLFDVFDEFVTILMTTSARNCVESLRNLNHRIVTPCRTKCISHIFGI